MQQSNYRKTFICPKCNRVTRVRTIDSFMEPPCAVCKVPTIYTGNKRRIPRKNAKPKQWAAFWNSLSYKPGYSNPK